MIELSMLSVLVIAEVMVGLIALSGVLLFFHFKRRGQDKKVAKSLADLVKQEHESRIQQLRKILVEHYGLGTDKSESLLVEFNDAEMKIYQAIIQSYLKRDAALFIDIKPRIGRLIEHYEALETTSSSDTETEETDISVESAAVEQAVSVDESEELKKLKEENNRLLEELRGTMETMGRMLDEYSGLFTPEGDGKVSKEKIAELVAEESNAAESADEDQPTPESMEQVEIENKEEVTESDDLLSSLSADNSDAANAEEAEVDSEPELKAADK